MVTTSSSQPKAIDGRVEPRREVRQTAARPERRPVRRKRTSFTRATRTPEKSAPIGLLPMA